MPTDRLPAILAVGLCSPLGATFAETARRYAAGERAQRLERALVGADGLPPTLAQAIPIAECRDYGRRLRRLLAAALADCAGRVPPPPGGWLLRLTVRPELCEHPDRDAFRASLLEPHAGLLRDLDLLPGGPAEALSDLAHAAVAVRDGAEDHVLVGALDSAIHPLLLDRLAVEERILMRGNPWGLIPGEAAVVMALGLETGEPAHGPGRGAVLGVFRGVEEEDVAAPRGLIGRGLAKAFARGARFLPPDRLLADLTGERWRAEEFGVAVARAAAPEAGIAALAADPETPALHLGDCGTAAGLLLPALALADPPPRAAAGPVAMVSVSSRETGARAVGFVERCGAGAA
ncbi:3-oxoacyl-[acyl-carrier-protein] synthase-1 [Methylobacterium sp. ap11]|uniref:hypothetical protein n=1 Tax=Methylobacterium sp. ap11 TaxID=1761799 RepID=UPI0008B4454B|nr:hypothetical protein [Methylobacterium sp. ap11]SEO73679.1 3-oxoacyl-[acyl-carrier-protein] synthase-1 [Methylobacterium sp. ap11]